MKVGATMHLLAHYFRRTRCDCSLSKKKKKISSLSIKALNRKEPPEYRQGDVVHIWRQLPPKGQESVSGKVAENCFVPRSNEVVRNDNDFLSKRGQSRRGLGGTRPPLPKLRLTTSVIIIGTGCDVCHLLIG